MIKLLLKSVIFFGFIVIFIDSKSQCIAEVEFKLNTIQREARSTQILLHSKVENINTKVQLYDLNLGKVVDEATTELNQNYKAIFNVTRSSYYVLIVHKQDCKKPLILTDGESGILIEN